MHYSSFFLILFISVCFIAMVIGLLVLFNNRKSPANKIFFALSLAINIWSLGLAFATVAPNAVIFEYWRRFSAIGWGTAYAFILHFILIITGYHALLKKWWFRLCLYLPVVLCLFAFAIPSGIPSTTLLVFLNLDLNISLSLDKPK
jgi:hypothetical protein